MNHILEGLIDRYPDLIVCREDIQKSFGIMKKSFEQGGKLLICGNGGSAADSGHMVGELMKGFVRKRVVPQHLKERLEKTFPCHGGYLAAHLQGALPAISLTCHEALMTACSNDGPADMVFAQQVYGYGKPGDVLLGISTSGNAGNVVHALKVAKVQGLHTIGLTGEHGGSIKPLCDAIICVPWRNTLEVQERHLPVYHALCMMLEDAFFPE